MKIFFKLWVLIVLLYSCRSDNKKVEPSILGLDTLQNQTIVDEYPADSIYKLKIQFNNLTLLLEEIDMNWDNLSFTQNDSLYTSQSDTAYFYILPGMGFDDKQFKVSESEFDQIELYEKIIYIISSDDDLQADNSKCKMNVWKRFESDWNKIPQTKDTLRFNSKEKEIPAEIIYSVEEYRTTVKEQCGEDGYNEIKNIISLEELPIEIFQDKHIFKILAKNSLTGKVVIKYIVFENPSSC